VSAASIQYSLLSLCCVDVKCEIKNNSCYMLSVAANMVYIKCLLTMVLCNKLVYWIAFQTLSMDVRPIPGLSLTFTLMR